MVVFMMKKKEESGPVELKLVQNEKNGVQISSAHIKKLRALEEWHQKNRLSRTWLMSKDGNSLLLI